MKLSMDDILLINALEKISRVQPKDCIKNENTITYLVKEKEIGKAIGKKAINVKELEKKLGKKIEIIGEYNQVKEVLEKTFNVKVEKETKKNGKIILKLNPTDKKKIFSRINKLKRLQEIVRRNYNSEMILN